MLILASASPRRLDLLRQIGVVPDMTLPADIDETPLQGEKPRDYACRISAAKAATVSARHPESLILSADTVVAVGRRILPKTENRDDAQKCLTLLSGRRHQVLTAVTLQAPGQAAKTKLVTTAVRFKRLSDDEVETYLGCGEWQGKAGGYAIQGHAAALISFISGSYSGTVGLPLFETAALLKQAGYAIA